MSGVATPLLLTSPYRQTHRAEKCLHHRLVQCDMPFLLILSMWIYSTREPIEKKNILWWPLTDAADELRLAEMTDSSANQRESNSSLRAPLPKTTTEVVWGSASKIQRKASKKNKKTNVNLHKQISSLWRSVKGTADSDWTQPQLDAHSAFNSYRVLVFYSYIFCIFFIK